MWRKEDELLICNCNLMLRSIENTSIVKKLGGFISYRSLFTITSASREPWGQLNMGPKVAGVTNMVGWSKYVERVHHNVCNLF